MDVVMAIVAIILMAGGIYFLVFLSKPKNIAGKSQRNVRLLKICGILLILCNALLALSIYMTRQ